MLRISGFSNRLVSAILLLSITSCAKEQNNEKPEPQPKEDIVLTASFESSDRLWSEDNLIWLSDGVDSFTAKVSAADDGKESFSFVLPKNLTGSNVYAVFPASAQDGFSESGKLVLRIPSNQDGTRYGGDVSVGRVEKDRLVFKSVMSCIKFQFGDGVEKLMIPEVGLTGCFEYNLVTKSVSPSTTEPVYGALNVLPPNPSKGVDYFATIGPVTLKKGTLIVAKDGASCVGSTMLDADKELTPEEEYSFGTVEANNRVFSVGTDKKVVFSRANLIYDVNSQKWGFFEHQYDYQVKYSADTISMHLWGYNPVKSIKPGTTGLDNISQTTQGKFKKEEDWGYIFGGTTSPWRTLTGYDSKEWEYLVKTRGQADYQIKPGVSVCGTPYCLVIAPDCNTEPIADSYDETSWAVAEVNGFVCLPPCGYRDGETIKFDTNGRGDYNSSTVVNDSKSYILIIKKTLGGVSSTNGGRQYGRAVRLVAE